MRVTLTAKQVAAIIAAGKKGKGYDEVGKAMGLKSHVTREVYRSAQLVGVRPELLERAVGVVGSWQGLNARPPELVRAASEPKPEPKATRKPAAKRSKAPARHRTVKVAK